MRISLFPFLLSLVVFAPFSTMKWASPNERKGDRREGENETNYTLWPLIEDCQGREIIHAVRTFFLQPPTIPFTPT